MEKPLSVSGYRVPKVLHRYSIFTISDDFIFGRDVKNLHKSHKVEVDHLILVDYGPNLEGFI